MRTRKKEGESLGTRLGQSCSLAYNIMRMRVTQLYGAGLARRRYPRLPLSQLVSVHEQNEFRSSGALSCLRLFLGWRKSTEFSSTEHQATPIKSSYARQKQRRSYGRGRSEAEGLLDA